MFIHLRKAVDRAINNNRRVGGLLQVLTEDDANKLASDVMDEIATEAYPEREKNDQRQTS